MFCFHCVDLKSWSGCPFMSLWFCSDGLSLSCAVMFSTVLFYTSVCQCVDCESHLQLCHLYCYCSAWMCFSYTYLMHWLIIYYDSLSSSTVSLECVGVCDFWINAFWDGTSWSVFGFSCWVNKGWYNIIVRHVKAFSVINCLSVSVKEQSSVQFFVFHIHALKNILYLHW